MVNILSRPSPEPPRRFLPAGEMCAPDEGRSAGSPRGADSRPLAPFPARGPGGGSCPGLTPTLPARPLFSDSSVRGAAGLGSPVAPSARDPPCFAEGAFLGPVSPCWPCCTLSLTEIFPSGRRARSRLAAECGLLPRSRSAPWGSGSSGPGSGREPSPAVPQEGRASPPALPQGSGNLVSPAGPTSPAAAGVGLGRESGSPPCPLPSVISPRPGRALWSLKSG